MKLAFYKADKGNWKDKLINVWTGRYGYSHVELLFDENICFSASPREGRVRFKQIKDIYTSGKWNIIEISPLISEQEVIENCNKITGLPYDWIGIFFHQSIIFPSIRNKYGIEDPDKYWCSEAIQSVLEQGNIYISPNEMAKLWNIQKY
jgi:hypothetical protein